MENFPILEMPEEMQALVFERVAGNSFKNLYSLRASCKWMKALAERRRVYHFFDVLSVPWGILPPELLKTCFAERNPSTLYIQADAGYERTEYAHAMTRKIFWNDDSYFARFPRESVVRIGEQVRSVKWGWGLWHADEFRAKRAAFISYAVPSFYSCQCTRLVKRQCICLWHIDNSKDDNMCNRCFWIREVGLFFCDFEPISLFTDTRK
ncbi:Uncharacterized protein Rs2_49224 [Raphanus sativus]|nr:Uncharacterized protein Rs2_51871 [Raphanus sativus]KAJ4869229.1 Uncharacterized protein Rs2_49224 [Raphanus sativus]